MLASALVGLLSLVLAALLRSRLIFAIASICWVQNLALPWWYTEGWIGEAATRSLLVMKELLLLLLVGYAAWRARATWRTRIPPPIVWILAYGAWAVVRIGLGVALGSEPLLDDLRLFRSVLFPVETVLAGFLVAMLAPRLPARYARFTVIGLTVCAVVSLALYFLPSETFWLNHVNIASYNVNVKGDPDWTVLANLGVSGTAAGRAGFEGLADFRLIGTFGDPLTAGMALGLAILALAAERRLRIGMVAAGLVLGVALGLSFSRSAWVLVGAGFTYLAILQRRPARLVALAAAAAVLWVAVAPLREFAAASVAAFALESGGDVYHAQGILVFYSTEILRPAYILGMGPIDTAGQSWVLENGFAYLLVQFGLPLLVTFVGFCVSAERYLRRHSTAEDVLPRVGAACALASLVVTNFSYYALSFTAYYGIWSVVGLGLGLLHRGELEAAGAVALAEPVEAES